MKVKLINYYFFDSDTDNPFRPDGDLAKEAQEDAQKFKYLSNLDKSTSSQKQQSSLNETTISFNNTISINNQTTALLNNTNDNTVNINNNNNN